MGLLTDCIGLSTILRNRGVNQKMLEYALYISTFSNLALRYTVGSSLFLCDLLIRQFNKVFLHDDKQKLSEVWAKFSPPLKKEHVGAELSPQMLSDLLLVEPQKEVIDCFAKRKFYSQSLSRYHKRNDQHLGSIDPIPVECDFLASLYLGFNGAKMTKEQFEELEKSIRNTPALSLARRIPQHGNLNALRKRLFDLGIHNDLISIIRRKYFPELYWDKNLTTAKEHLDTIDLPHEVAQVVRKAWGAADGVDKVTELVRKQQVDVSMAESAVHCGATSEHYPASTPKSKHNQLISGNVEERQSLLDYYNKMVDNKEITEGQLLEVFGLQEDQLRSVFQPIARILMVFSYYLKTGDLLSENETPQFFENMFCKKDWESLRNNEDVSVETLIKLLILIINYMESHPFFLFRNICRIPYSWADTEHFTVSFNYLENSFDIFLSKDLTFTDFSSVSLKFPLCFITDQLVDFELNTNLEMVQVSCVSTNPPYHAFHELVLHSLIRQGYILRSGTKLGKLQILCLNSKVKFVPIQYPQKLINQLANKNEEIKITNSRKNLSDTLARLILLKQNKVQFLTEGNLYDTGSKQVHVQMLAQVANVNEDLIPKKNGKFKKYDDTIARLNAIIMGQYLIRSNMSIEPDDVKEFQNSDPFLKNIISQLQENPPAKNVDQSFVLIKQLLFKIEMIFGERVYKLCLPPIICEQILLILHDSVKAHLSRENLVNHFNRNFFTRGITDISKKIVSKCLHCSLNLRKRKLSVKGQNRTYEKSLAPGQLWFLDVLVLPRSSSGNAFVLVFTERLSSYIAALPLKNITNQSVCEALSQFREPS